MYDYETKHLGAPLRRDDGNSSYRKQRAARPTSWTRDVEVDVEEACLKKKKRARLGRPEIYKLQEKVPKPFLCGEGGGDGWRGSEEKRCGVGREGGGREGREETKHPGELVEQGVDSDVAGISSLERESV